MRSVVSRSVIALFLMVFAQGCVHRAPALTPRPAQFTRTLAVNGFPIALHFSRPSGAAVRPVLIYATGDGGWHGKDLDLFHHLASWGYPIVGFSAPEYVKHLQGEDETTTPARLARDYELIIAAAKDSLAASIAQPVILVGVSRGAGLAVVAAGQPDIQQRIDGVVVMGLTKEEEHVRWRRRRQSTELKIYDYLPRLGDVPIAVIQSTRDNYLPADQARALFGIDTERRQFHAIDARNHSFSGARPLLYDVLHTSLEWVARFARRPALRFSR